jgi:O-antigen/teichoic acid export membrane protein
LKAPAPSPNRRGHRLFRNAGFLTAGRSLGDACNFVLFVAISRTYGQEGIGEYAFVMAITGFAAIAADFGLYFKTIRDIGRGRSGIEEYCSTIFAIRLLLVAINLAVIVLLVALVPMSLRLALLFLLLGAYQVTQTLVDGFAAILVAVGDARRAALVELTTRALVALLGVAVAVFGGSLVLAVTAFPVVSLAMLVVAHRIARLHATVRLRRGQIPLRRVLLDAGPFALSEVLAQLAVRLDTILLGFLLGFPAAGLYNVAYRVILFVQMIPNYGAISLLPEVSRLHVTSEMELRHLYAIIVNVCILFGLPASAGVWLIAPEVIILLFGPEFGSSILVLRVLSPLLLLAFFRLMLSIFLMGCDRQLIRTKCEWLAAGLRILAAIIAIPAFGVVGAALAAVGSEIVLVALFIGALTPVVGIPKVATRLAISGIATAGFLVPFALMPQLPLAVVIPTAALIYFGVLCMFRSIRQGELQFIVQLLADIRSRQIQTL